MGYVQREGSIVHKFCLVSQIIMQNLLNYSFSIVHIHSLFTHHVFLAYLIFKSKYRFITEDKIFIGGSCKSFLTEHHIPSYSFSVT